MITLDETPRMYVARKKHGERVETREKQTASNAPVYGGVFTTCVRVRLHIWRLGLTALILKNCHLFPDDLLSLLVPPSERVLLLFFPIQLVQPLHASPPTPFSRRRDEITPLCTVQKQLFSFHRFFSFSRIVAGISIGEELPPSRRISVLVNVGDTHIGFSPFAGCLYVQVMELGITKWQEYVVGISGKIVWG